MMYNSKADLIRAVVLPLGLFVCEQTEEIERGSLKAVLFVARL